MVSEDEDGKLMFKVNYHYMSQVKNASDTNSAARSRRLAQEAVTLSTSLPLSSSSSVFVRCDEERLDIMKVKYHFSVFSTILGPLPQYKRDIKPNKSSIHNWVWLLGVCVGMYPVINRKL